MKIHSVKLFFGDHDKRQKDKHEIQLVVNPEQIFTHKDYDPATNWNDIALLKLPESLPLSSSPITPICLPESLDQSENQECMVSGWGDTQWQGSPSTVLREVEQRILPEQKCQMHTAEQLMQMPGNQGLEDQIKQDAKDGVLKNMTLFLCAFAGEGKDSCQGELILFFVN